MWDRVSKLQETGITKGPIWIGKIKITNDD